MARAVAKDDKRAANLRLTARPRRLAHLEPPGRPAGCLRGSLAVCRRASVTNLRPSHHRGNRSRPQGRAGLHRPAHASRGRHGHGGSSRGSRLRGAVRMGTTSSEAPGGAHRRRLPRQLTYASRERCWIAEMDGQALWATSSWSSTRSSRDTARLRLLYIDPAARGMGLGARLVEQCVQFARAAGYRKITLWTPRASSLRRTVFTKAARLSSCTR